MKRMKSITMDLLIHVPGMPAPPEPNHEKKARERKMRRCKERFSSRSLRPFLVSPILPGEALESHGGSEASGHEGPTHSNSLQSSVHHLVAIAGAAALVKVGHVVAAGERCIGNLLLEELAQRSPAVVNVVLQQTVRGHQAADLGNVLIVDLLALAGEVPAEEGLEELVEHGVVHAGGPAEVRDELVLGVADAPVDGLHDGGVPRVHVARGQDDLGVGVGLDQLLCKRAGGPVAHGLAVAQQLVPFLAPEFANALVLGVQGIVPHQAVGRVLNAGTHHMVALGVTQALQSFAESYRAELMLVGVIRYTALVSLTGSTGTANTQGQHLHGHRPVALATVNACVIGEDISDRLRRKVVGEHERHDGRLQGNSR